MLLPYHEEPWETAQYQAYVLQARRFKESNHVSDQQRMVKKAEDLKRDLIAKYTAEQEQQKAAMSEAAIDAIADGKLPEEFYKDVLTQAAEGVTKKASLPVVLIVAAGVIFYYLKKRKR